MKNIEQLCFSSTFLNEQLITLRGEQHGSFQPWFSEVDKIAHREGAYLSRKICMPWKI